MSDINFSPRALLAFAACAAAIGVDLVTKWLILNVVMQPPRLIELTPFFNLTLGFNTGVSFGMFRDVFLDHPLLLAGFKAVIAAGLLVWAMRTDNSLETFALGLIAGGAVGNVLDRVRHGAVTDFLDFHVGGWHWYTFNMADVAITVGAALLIAGVLWPIRPVASVPADAREAER